jgi:hypothetical protein
MVLTLTARPRLPVSVALLPLHFPVVKLHPALLRTKTLPQLPHPCQSKTDEKTTLRRPALTACGSALPTVDC